MPQLSCLTDEDFRAVKSAYLEQIAFGSDRNTAMNLATIVYQQRNPSSVLQNSRDIVGNVVAEL